VTTATRRWNEWPGEGNSSSIWITTGWVWATPYWTHTLLEPAVSANHRRGSQTSNRPIAKTAKKNPQLTR